ncbi:MDR/zinc-dependent alcohol dehydrogenase-like family protein [Sphingosinicella rhizophila]|uniref:Zinc-binding dehydrogenase n=1 Tax=Sphingosinicella rhizophila TaxID=3050082 RepID=A0ABU3QAF5_9SPHN|nr:zinc-binding dehydrogenase [Sphingosinicella sp. GR2756]MDT9600384.1 zinc-binding dehydrogenase [Sphingosinicella sp. GR2756]
MSRATMLAAVITSPGRAEIQEVTVPEPGPREVRIKLEGCGVCASNLTPWAGPDWMQFPTSPGALGHEGWGSIDAVGSDVPHLSRGDRVASLSGNSYAEFDVADASAVIRLPDELADQDFPVEPFGCAMNIFRRSGIEAGQDVAVIGIGFLGAILVKLASDAGARVIAISRRPCSLDLARKMGAAETIPMDDHGAIIDQVKAFTDGRLCDRTIEAVGKQWPLDLAGELTGEGGRLIIAGYHQDGPRQVNMQMWNWRGLDVVNAHERNPQTCLQGMREAIDAVASGRIDPDLLLTHRYRLHELGEALDATRDRPPGFVKALVMLR